MAETEPFICQWAADSGLPLGRMMNSLRLAILGISQGPSIFAICEFIGKEETLARMDAALAALGTPAE